MVWVGISLAAVVGYLLGSISFTAVALRFFVTEEQKSKVQHPSTQLFSLAKAVVSESGGLLSHCSIVAREYGIPAVVPVDAATQIEDGTTLAVDGNNGLVVVMRSD